MAYLGVHLTHLISEIVKMITKVNLHLLKLLYDGLEGHTPAAEEEGAEEEGAEEDGAAGATGSVVSTRGRFD